MVSRSRETVENIRAHFFFHSARFSYITMVYIYIYGETLDISLRCYSHPSCCHYIVHTVYTYVIYIYIYKNNSVIYTVYTRHLFCTTIVSRPSLLHRDDEIEDRERRNGPRVLGERAEKGYGNNSKDGLSVFGTRGTPCDVRT